MSDLPVLLLDVDGVLSPFPDIDGTVADTWPDWTQVAATMFHLKLSSTMAEQLEALPAARVWCTTWQHNANAVVAPALGWDPLPVVPCTYRSPHPYSRIWKLSAVQHYVAALPVPPPAVVWVDDELEGFSDLATAVQQARDDSDGQLFGGIPELLVCPDSLIALEPDHITDIARFLHRHSPTLPSVYD